MLKELKTRSDLNQSQSDLKESNQNAVYEVKKSNKKLTFVVITFKWEFLNEKFIVPLNWRKLEVKFG